MNVTNVINTVGQYKEAFDAATETKKDTGWMGTIGGKFGDVLKIGGMAVNGVANVYTGITKADLNAATTGCVQIALVAAAVGIGILNPGAGITVGALAAGNQDFVLQNGAKFLNGITPIKVNPEAVAAVAQGVAPAA